MRIQSVYAGFPGSAHDANILRLSGTYEIFEAGRFPSGWLQGSLLNISAVTQGMEKDTVQSMLLNIPIFGISSEVVPLIMDQYFGDTDDPLEIRNRFIELCGDVIFFIPGIKTANYHRDSNLPVYFYEFQHRPSLFVRYKPDYVKSDHTDELFSVFGGPFLGSHAVFSGPATDEEKFLSRTVMRYWANFARNGDPNGPGLVVWPQYGHEEHYLEINLKQKPAKKLIENRVKFWTVTLPEKIQKMQQDKVDRTEL
ncbi:fatty acyl-CoA hydrolase precursor, medium chain-like [Discoglossus pictus]